MRGDEAGMGAAGERAAAVARPERASDRDRRGAPAASDAERRAVRTIDDRDDTAVAAQAPHRLEREVAASLAFHQRAPIDVHEDLMRLRAPGMIVRVPGEIALRQRDQR